MDYPKLIVSYQKEESISIQRIKVHRSQITNGAANQTYATDCVMLSPQKTLYILNFTLVNVYVDLLILPVLPVLHRPDVVGIGVNNL